MEVPATRVSTPAIWPPVPVSKPGLFTVMAADPGEAASAAMENAKAATISGRNDNDLRLMMTAGIPRSKSSINLHY
ncbi:hypothetical protein llg_12260 [Luteolibacter sp. LG18]|nr:hypothetical protein llg_12260 [Luteolibacter sp. LG18]